MRRRIFPLVAALSFVAVLATPSLAAPNARVTIDDRAGSYVRYDGGTDTTTNGCSTGRRQQNEPSVAVDPSSPNVVVAGANDYCSAIVNDEVWTGYYRSTDGGRTWTNSLVPGYPDDTSAAGTASPVHGSCAAAGDPTQSFDADGNLFYAFICFNRSAPVNGSVYVAKYTNHGATYDRTVLVKSGTPSGLFLTGLFQDKINLTVDQTAGAYGGNVYVAWSQYDGFAPTNAVLFSRSTNGGLSFSRPIRLTPKERGTASFADLAVGPEGTVWLTYLTYPSSSRPTADIWLQRSTSGGVSFEAPIHVASIELFDSNQFAGTTGTVDCGDGPFECESGLTFSRFFSNSAVTADETGVHVVWGSELPSGQSKVFVRNSTDGGHSWTESVVSTSGSNFGWMTHGSRRVGFWGDYLYVSAVSGAVNVVWTDSRDLVGGVDPREGADVEGFDVLQPCTYVPNDIDAPSYSSPTIDDPCLSKGGLDQNIYGARV